MMADVRYEIIVTNTMIRADAVTVVAAPFANRLAETHVPWREAVVALAAIRCCAYAVGACLGAEGYATTVRVLRVTFVANANAGCVTRLVIPARDRVAGRFEALCTHAHRAVV